MLLRPLCLCQRSFTWGFRCAEGCENREPGPLFPTLLLTGCALPSRPQGWMKGQGGLNVSRSVISSSICSCIYHHRTGKMEFGLRYSGYFQIFFGGGRGKKITGGGKNIFSYLNYHELISLWYNSSCILYLFHAFQMGSHGHPGQSASASQEVARRPEQLPLPIFRTD